MSFIEKIKEKYRALVRRISRRMLKFLLKLTEKSSEKFKTMDKNDPNYARMKEQWEKRERWRMLLEYEERGAPSTRMSDIIAKTLEAKQKSQKDRVRKDGRKKRAQS